MGKRWMLQAPWECFCWLVAQKTKRVMRAWSARKSSDGRGLPRHATR